MIIGVNGAGYDSDNESMTEGRDLPWLQEMPGDNVWTSWNVTYRDVVVLDAENVFVEAYNLTEQSLGEEANMSALRAILEGAVEP